MRRLWRPVRWLAGRSGAVAFTVLAAGVAGGFWSQRELVRDEAAERCVDDWQIAEQSRKVAPISNEALILVFPDADPDRIVAVREVTARLVEERIADPECDLEAARRRLGR